MAETRTSALPSWLNAYTLLLAVAGLLRLVRFTALPDDVHEWRQTQTLMLAQSYEHGANLLLPRALWEGNQVAVLELPIYSWFVYLLARVVDIVIAGRLLSLAFGIASIALFAWLCKRLRHPRPRLATVFFALTPVAIFYGHAVQPEPLLLSLVLTAAVAFELGTESFWWLALAALSLAIAGTIKPTALVTLTPVIAWQAWRRRSLLPAGVVLGAGAAAVLGWAAFTRQALLAVAPGWYYWNSRPDWLWGPLGLRLSGDFYQTLLFRAFFLLLPPFLVVLLVPAMRRSGIGYWWTWLAGAVASCFVFAELSYVHFYYELLAIPALAALAAAGAPAWQPRRLVTVALAILLVVAAAVRTVPLWQPDPIYAAAGAALGQRTPRQAEVAVVSRQSVNPYFPDVLWYAQRSGWNLPPSATAAELDGLTAAHGVCDGVIVLDGSVASSYSIPSGWNEEAAGPGYHVIHSQAAACAR